jgi:integrase
MASAGQLKRDKEKYGKRKSPWYCFWRNPEGRARQRKCGVGPDGKKLADRLAMKINGELVMETYTERGPKTWKAFYHEYYRLVISQGELENGELAITSIGHFVRICAPLRASAINRMMLDEFVAVRRKEPGRRRGSRVSRSTINKELRYIRNALRTAFKWGFTTREPDIPFVKEMQRIETFISMDEFSALYAQCNAATSPAVHGIEPETWWRAFIVTMYMTGWRVSEVLSLRWEHVDFEKGTIFSPAEEQKGRRDEEIPLHNLIVERLETIKGDRELIFPIKTDCRRLYDEFQKIQDAAEVKSKDGYYAFHDLRRGFATENADSMDLFELQKLMKHRSLGTTQKYAAMAHRLRKPVDNLKVPVLA